jgi:hypothetical protein
MQKTARRTVVSLRFGQFRACETLYQATAEGVGSRFRPRIHPMGRTLAENDSRPRVFNLSLSRPIGLIPFLGE